MSAHQLKLAMILAALATAIPSAGLRAADKKPDAAKTDAKEAAKPDDEPKDRYQLPEGGVKELLAFIKDLRTYRPTTRDEQIEYMAKFGPAMKAAGQKLQQVATDEDKKLKTYQEAMEAMLVFRASEARSLSPEERKQLTDEIKSHLTSTAHPPEYAISAAGQLAVNLEYGSKPKEAIDVYRELGAILVKSADDRASKTGARMEGAARRLDLMGRPLEIGGTLMDGKKFDWAAYRGKVVLVDFWATWCGPCRAELPNVKKNYEKYHDHGFEVVGISLDGDREALEKFLETEQNPWPTLHDGDWNDNAVASYYGIMGIPTVILVDKEGKVVSTRARGDELGKQLAALLGPVEDDEK